VFLNEGMLANLWVLTKFKVTGGKNQTILTVRSRTADQHFVGWLL
jgi:hypothetical protein